MPKNVLKKVFGWRSHKSQSNYELFSQHVRSFFVGHVVTERFWRIGPAQKTLPNFRIIEVEPGPRAIPYWIYISSGVWEAYGDDSPMEFMLIAPDREIRYPELIAMVAYYHSEPKNKLAFGHTFPIGEPWIGDSECDHVLVSKPYYFGTDLEVWKTRQGHGHLMWLLPITKSERDYKMQYGLEELERKLEDSLLDYWLPNRKSII